MTSKQIPAPRTNAEAGSIPILTKSKIPHRPPVARPMPRQFCLRGGFHVLSLFFPRPFPSFSRRLPASLPWPDSLESAFP